MVFAGGFLVISSSFRGWVMDAFNALVTYTGAYSPYSYVVMALIALAGITLTLRTGQAAR